MVSHVTVALQVCVLVILLIEFDEEREGSKGQQVIFYTVVQIERVMAFIAQWNLSLTDSGNNVNLSLAENFYSRQDLEDPIFKYLYETESTCSGQKCALAVPL